MQPFYAPEHLTHYGAYVEYGISVPTVLGISVKRGKFIPAATVSGISWENGGLDDVVESCEIIVGRFISGLS